MPDAFIHLRVPASLKARWVRLSRAKGQRLTDWLIERVERPMAVVQIPDTLTFADLRLALEADGSVTFDADVIRRISEASGLDLAADEEALASLITRWYRAHRERGGYPDPVAEAMLAEIAAEDSRGQRFSLQPGKA